MRPHLRPQLAPPVYGNGRDVPVFGPITPADPFGLHYGVLGWVPLTEALERWTAGDA